MRTKVKVKKGRRPASRNRGMLEVRIAPYLRPVAIFLKILFTPLVVIGKFFFFEADWSRDLIRRVDGSFQFNLGNFPAKGKYQFINICNGLPCICWREPGVRLSRAIMIWQSTPYSEPLFIAAKVNRRNDGRPLAIGLFLGMLIASGILARQTPSIGALISMLAVMLVGPPSFYHLFIREWIEAEVESSPWSALESFEITTSSAYYSEGTPYWDPKVIIAHFGMTAPSMEVVRGLWTKSATDERVRIFVQEFLVKRHEHLMRIEKARLEREAKQAFLRAPSFLPVHPNEQSAYPAFPAPGLRRTKER